MITSTSIPTLERHARDITDELIERAHIQEWKNSGIADDLIEANLVSLEGDEALNVLFASDDLPRINTGRVAGWLLNRYDHCRNGGWYCRSYDPITKEEMEWIQFKPDTPRNEYKGFSSNKEKIIKYESTPKMKAKVILPYVPLERWIEISNKYNCPIDFDKYFNFWDWVIANPKIPVSITEGGKKACSLLSHNLIAIALPGVTMGIRRIDSHYKELHPYLQLFATGGRKFFVLYDSDTKPKTVKNVSKALFSLGSQLKFNKCDVYVCQWESEKGKGIDDVIYAADNPEKTLINIYESATEFNYWAVKRLFKLRKPDMRFNSRWFSDGLATIPNCRLVALKSPQNTGKTEVIIKEVQQLVDNGEPVFVFTHRESLARALGQRFGIAYRTEKDPLKGFVGYSLCVDSLMPKYNGFNVDDWDNVTVVVDEVEQVLHHLLHGLTTVQDYRPTIIKTLIELAPKIKQMIIADADLSDISLDFFEGLLGCQAYLVENEYKFESMSFNRCKSQEQLLKLTEDKLAAEKKLFIVTTAQKAKSKYGTIGLEHYLKKHFPHLNILRIDSESSGYPNSDSQKALTNMNTICVKYDVVICSPSIETGISVDVHGHFNSVIGFNSGNLPPHNFLQFLWRLRDISVERYFYSPNSGKNWVGNGSSSPTKLLETTDKLAKNIMSNLGSLDSEYDLQGISKLFLDTWAKIGARINAGSRCYKTILTDLIESQGHTLTDCTYDELPKEVIIENNQECIDINHNQILNSADLDEVTADKLQQQKAKTQTEIDQLKKHKVKEKYGEINKEILEADDDGFYSKLKLYYYCTIGNQFVEERDKQVVNNYLKDNDNQLFAPDVVRSTIKHKAEMINRIGLLDLIEEIKAEGTITNKDPRILELWEQAKQRRGLIKNTLGVDVGKYPMAFFNSLLKTIGYSLGDRQQRKRANESYYQYSIVELPQWTEQVLTYWLNNDKQKKEQRVLNEQASKVPNFQYINIGKIGDPEKLGTQEKLGTLPKEVETISSSNGLGEWIGKAVNYLHPQKWEQQGIVETIKGQILYIRDLLTNELLPCAKHQVELVGLGT